MRSLFAAFSLSALCLLGCHDSVAKHGGDSNSNWLKACSSQAECGSELMCVCGVCTVECSGDSACGRTGTEAVCAATDPLGCGAQGARVCLESCERSSACDDTLACRDEVCGRFQSEPRDGGDPEPLDAMLADSSTREDAGLSDASVVDPGGDAGDASGQAPIYEGPGCEPARGDRAACSSFSDCAEGELCHIDGTCIAPGACDALGRATLSNVGAIRVLLSDATHVYLLNAGTEDGLSNHNGDGAVLRIPLLGGALSTVVGERVRPFDLVIDGERLYWVENYNGELALWQADKSDGGNVGKIMDVGHMHWAQSPTHLYFVAEESESSLELFAIEKASGGITPLTDENWTSTAELVVDDDRILLNAYDTVLTVPLSGGVPTPFPRAWGLLDCMAVGEDRIYGASYQSEFLQAVSKTGDSVTNLGQLVDIPLALQPHRDHVYFSVKDDDTSSPEIRRAPIAPGETELLAAPSGTVDNRFDMPFIVNDRGLYYVQSGRLVRQVIPELERLEAAAQGGNGGPCHADLGCDGDLICRNTVCREP